MIRLAVSVVLLIGLALIGVSLYGQSTSCGPSQMFELPQLWSCSWAQLSLLLIVGVLAATVVMEAGAFLVRRLRMRLSQRQP